MGRSQSILGTRAPRRRSHVYKSWPTLNHSAWSTDHLTFSFCLTHKLSGPPPFHCYIFQKLGPTAHVYHPTHVTFSSLLDPPPSFSGATFSCWGDPPSMHTGYPHYYYFTLTYEYEYDTIYKISLSNYQRPFSKRKVYQRPTLHVQVLNSRDHILTH